jgi:hypothetical protein
MQGRLQIIHYSSLLNGSAEKAAQKGDERRRVEVLMMNAAIAYHRSWALSRPRSAQKSGGDSTVLLYEFSWVCQQGECLGERSRWRSPFLML